MQKSKIEKEINKTEGEKTEKREQIFQNQELNLKLKKPNKEIRGIKLMNKSEIQSKNQCVIEVENILNFFEKHFDWIRKNLKNNKNEKFIL